MEFFERAHVIQKHSTKKENKSEGAVKKQLKQMLQAYKKGNNEEIKSCADTEHRYDVDDIKSVSDFSDISFRKEAGSSSETGSSRASEELQSNSTYSHSNEPSFSKSNVTHPESTGSLESIHEYEEDFKSLSLSRDISTTDKDYSSTFESSILSGEYSDSEISIPSSLQTSSGEIDGSDNEAFDADGALAIKILEKLSKNMEQSKKRKLTKEDLGSSSSEKEKKRQVKDSLPKKVVKEKSQTLKKASKGKDFTSTKISRVLVATTETDLHKNISGETSEDSFLDQAEFENSQSSEHSKQFISVSVSDMQSQSLNDIVGDYVHTTVRNLPSDKQNIVYSHSSKYAILDEVMSVDNVEEISSLIPEIDEDLTENLTLETDPQEPTEESSPYDDTVQTEDYFEQESSIHNIEPVSVPIKVYSCQNNYILVMEHPAELFIHGKVKVLAIGGSVEVFGYKLLDESIDLFAPYCNFAHSIKTIKNQSSFDGLFSKLASAGLTASEAQEIITTVTEHDAIIALSRLNSPKMDFVDDNFNVAELFTKRVDQTPDILKKAAENLGCSLYLDQPKRVLEERSSWEQIIACGKASQSRGIICGGKGTGKSTLLRYCINRLINNGPVLVIDLDPGQAEFTVPGNISVSVVYQPLIGPNFTHLRQPEKTLNIGMISPMDNPSRYISAVTQLISFCLSIQSYHTMPWIVNTMGMCNNMGLKFISYIILELQPTYLYQIDSKSAKKRFEFELQSHAVSNFCERHMKGRMFSSEKNPYSLDYTFILGVTDENGVSPQKGNGSALLPRDERYLNVLAYFGQLLDIYGKSILDIVPYEVNLRDLNIGVNVKIPEQAMTKVINGKIIALCQLAGVDKGKMFTLDDKALLCHGYGLIRSIDYEKGLLYILTPVPIEELKLVNTLVYADWMPELRGQEKELPSGSVIPYRTATVFQERQLMFPPRRRFNPIQLLKATRSA